MTTPEPAVSPAPDTDALRKELMQALSLTATANGVRLWDLRGPLADAAMHVFAEREAGLRADLDRARAEQLAAARAHRDELVNLRTTLLDLCGVLPEAREWAKAMDVVRAVVSQRDQYAKVVSTWQELWDDKEEWEKAAKDAWSEVNTLRTERDNALTEVRRLADDRYRLRRLARSAGARTIPDDAAERIHAVVEELCTGQDDANGGTVYFLDHHEGPQELAREVLKALGATPTTDPAPAAADVQWLPATFVNTAGGVGCASCNGYQALGHDGECYPYGQGPTPDRLPPNTRIVAAPQAPAEPTEDVAAIRAQQIAALTSGTSPRVDCAVPVPLTPGQIRRLLQEARNLKDEGHHAGETLELLLDPKLGELLDDIREVGHLIPRGPAGPAVPEDTATPDDEYGDDLAATFLRSSAGECREMVPDGPESYMSCGADTVSGTDRCDDHRADTTRPAGEES